VVLAGTDMTMSRSTSRGTAEERASTWKARIHSARRCSGGQVVGDQDGGVLVPESADGKLADVAVVVGELGAVVVDDLGSAVAAGAFELDRTPGR